MGKKQVVQGEVIARHDEPIVDPFTHPVTDISDIKARFPNPLYPFDDGTPILTNSMMGAFRRCIKQSEFKYVHRLKPKRLGGPLKRGKWVHELLEVDAKGGDWKKRHKKLSAKFNDMFDEEKDFYGDMPTEINRIMRSYMWHYKHDPWKYKEVELELTARLPNGVLIRIKFDALVETRYGLYLVDHKTHKSLPKMTYQTLDTQSPLYMWVARENGIKVDGFIWNYLRWKAPSIPELVYVGKPNERLSKKVTETDYPTFKGALKEYGLDPADYQDRLDYYKSLRYVPGEPQNSPFFRRVVREKDEDMIKRVLKEAMRTGERMNDYDFSDPDAVERTVGRHCEFMCSYQDVCTNQLMGNNLVPLLKQNYKIGDPMDYYHDREGETDKEID